MLAGIARHVAPGKVFCPGPQMQVWTATAACCYLLQNKPVTRVSVWQTRRRASPTLQIPLLLTWAAWVPRPQTSSNDSAAAALLLAVNGHGFGECLLVSVGRLGPLCAARGRVTEALAAAASQALACVRTRRRIGAVRIAAQFLHDSSR